MSAAQIPDSPAEPPVIIPDDQVDSTVRQMVIGPEAESIFLSGPPPSEASTTAFHNDQFGGPSGMNVEEDPSKSFPPMDPNMLSTMSAGLGNMTPEQLTQLLATLASQNGMYGQQPQQPGGHAQQIPPYGSVGNGASQEDWNVAHQQWGDYSGYQQEDGGDVQQQQQHQPSQRGGWDRGGFRGRGRGRGRGGGLTGDGFKDGRKRKPCTFFAQGRQVNLNPSLAMEGNRLSFFTGVDTGINVTSVTKPTEVPCIRSTLLAFPPFAELLVHLHGVLLSPFAHAL